MITEPHLPKTRERARRKTEEFAAQLRGGVLTETLWYEHLDPAERKVLGGDLEQAYAEFGMVGMWQELRGCSRVVSVLELARLFKLIDTEELDRLLDHLGEVPQDAELHLEQAVTAGHLVIRDDEERMMYWREKSLETPLLKSESLWSFLVELAKRTKSGSCVDTMCYPNSSDSYTRKTASRIRCDMGLPADLTTRIVSEKPYGQKLDLQPETIRVFESDGRRGLREWLP